MRLHSSLVACLTGTLGTAVAFSGCSARATATAQTERELPDDLPDGMVRIPDASRQFMVVEAAGPATEDGALRVPARVEFKDGAVSHVGAPLDGRVVHVHVSTGDTVRAGSPLVSLDCPEAASVRAAVDTANASLLEARASLDRERRMLEEGIGIEREKLAAQTRLAGLEAELARAQASTSFVGPGSGTAVMLRAPIAGTIITRKATEGMAVQRGTEPLVEIGDPSTLWIVAEVFERDLPLVREGASARVELPSLQQTLAGSVVSVGAVVSSGLRTAPVRISVALHSTPLRPGMYGRADIAVSHAAGSLTLPTEAVLIKGKETVVYIEKSPTTFERRAVVVGPPLNGRVQVVSGLVPGDRVVVRGALLLDGAADQLL